MRIRLTALTATVAVTALSAALLIGTAAPASACTGLSGSGTAGDPWLIASDADAPLVTMCMPTSGYFRQTADITVVTTSLVPGTFSGTYDGGNHTITFDGITDAEGVFSLTDQATVSDLSVAAINGATLSVQKGWLTGQDANSVFTAITTSGEISPDSGGIAGAYSTGTTITSSHTTGAIGNSGGGLVGGHSVDIVVVRSSASGAISIGAGGLIGQHAAGPSVTRSWSTGAIGNNGGGILGQLLNYSSVGKSATVTDSFSTGTIGIGGGGIIGTSANANANSSTLTVERAFSLGDIAADGGGIIGSSSNYGATNSSISISKSYSIGVIGYQGGGIVGSTSGDATTSTTMSVTDSYSAGDIILDGGGIIGAHSTGALVSNSYASGSAAYSDPNTASTADGIFGPYPNSPLRVNNFAESESGSPGFSDLHFNAVTSGIDAWGRGIWGSCQANTPPFLQAEFDRNPCRSTPTRSPAVIATLEGGPPVFALSRSSVNLGPRARFTLVNAIVGLPSQNLEVYADPGVLRLGANPCTQSTPCEIYSGSQFGGGQQALFTALRLGTVHVAYASTPTSASTPVGDLALRAGLTLKASRTAGSVTFVGHSRPLIASQPLTVMTKRAGESTFTATGTITNTDGTYTWTRRIAREQSLEVYVTDGFTESNHVTP